MGMPLKDLSESAVGLLITNYKVENEKVLKKLSTQLAKIYRDLGKIVVDF